MTKVAIVEDNATLRQYLAELIGSTPGHRCVCACASAEEALVEIPAAPPQRGADGHPSAGRIRHRLHGAACGRRLPNLQVIMLTVYKDIKMIFQALKAGACGYVLKRSDEKEILAAIAEVRAGGAPMTSEIARMVVRSFMESPSEHRPGRHGPIVRSRIGNPRACWRKALPEQGNRLPPVHQQRHGAHAFDAHLRKAACALPHRGGGQIPPFQSLRHAGETGRHALNHGAAKINYPADKKIAGEPILFQGPTFKSMDASVHVFRPNGQIMKRRER